MNTTQQPPAWLAHITQIPPDLLQRRYHDDQAFRTLTQLADAQIRTLTAERDYYHARAQQLGALIEQAQSLIAELDQRQHREP